MKKKNVVVSCDSKLQYVYQEKGPFVSNQLLRKNTSRKRNIINLVPGIDHYTYNDGHALSIYKCDEMMSTIHILDL